MLEIPVIYKGREYLFNARLLQMGYVHKIEVDVEDMHIHFEKDDDGAWRALLSQEDLENNKTVDPQLIEEIANVIQQATA